MSDGIERKDDSLFDVAIETIGNIASSGVIPFKGMAGGELHLASDPGLTLLTWHTSHDGETFVPAMARDGSGAVTQVIDGVGGYPIPDELYACHFIKATGNVAAVAHVTMKG